jgi:F-type H+-transporting ATPase subunit epsilon
MHLVVLTPEKELFKGEIKLVRLPGSNGSFEILNNHAPIISSLEEGEVKIVPDDGTEVVYKISGGVVECKQNNIILLIEKLLSE